MTFPRILVPFAVLAALVSAACADRAPLSPGARETPEAVAPEGTHGQRLECRVDVPARTLACGNASTAGIRGAIIGGQDQFVKVTSTGVTFDGTAHTLRAFVNVKNLLPYTLGTLDGATADSGGVKVFFHTGPTVTGGSGAVSVANADGVGAFTAAGQPFFKYPGRLFPGASSAAHLWVFAVDAGVQTFSFSVYVYAEVQASASRVLEPQRLDVVAADSLTVLVAAGPPPGVSSVRATLFSRTTLLTYLGDRQWGGKLNLAGLSRSQEVEVWVVAPTDSLLHRVAFTYVHPVDLALTLPLEGTVARPTLRIAGTCADAMPCTVNAYFFGTTLFTHTGPSFDFTVSLAGLYGPAGGPQTLTVRANVQDHTSTLRRTVFVEPSSHLVEVGSAGVEMLDVDSTRLLFRDSTAAGQEVALLDLPSGVRTLIHPLQPGAVVTTAYLTPAGAIVAAGLGIDSIFELRGGVVRSVGEAARYKLRVAGEWAAWHTSGLQLYRRNTTTGAQELLNAHAEMGDVADNGDVVFTASGTLRWRHGGTTLTLPQGILARTDGTQVVYHRTVNDLQGTFRHDGVSETLLGNRAIGPEGLPPYAVNGGWAAFVTPGTDGITHLFTRAPDGTQRQVTSTTALLPDALSSAGDVVWSYGSRLFSSVPYTSATAVSRIWPNPVRFRGTRAYTTIGRTGFRIVP